ncbi:MAG TPA: ribonuclease H-like domain-containing protein [Candidatus Acidoferrum sp.]
MCVRNWFSKPEFVEPSHPALELLSRNRDESLSKRTHAALSDPSKWLFLDTETTGLSGGAGTYAFLIGIAWWDAGGLQVDQFLMRDFAEEHSMLQELAARIAERPVLVTFNGKSFDWPLLETRFTMTRAIPKPQLATHLDLLHPARALWKLRLGSVRLVELEQHVLDPVKLGWHREDDVLSSAIPQHYFDYLRGGSAKPLADVLRHNQMDLRGLAALFEKIDALLTTSDAVGYAIDGLDMFGLSRYLQKRGDSHRARSACAKAIDLGLPVEHRRQANRELAALTKRQGNHEDAAALWHQLAGGSNSSDPHSVHACEQLAIYYESRLKNTARAQEFTQLALSKLKLTRIASRDPFEANRTYRMEDRLQRRIVRLNKKLVAKRKNQMMPLILQTDESLRAVHGKRPI